MKAIRFFLAGAVATAFLALAGTASAATVSTPDLPVGPVGATLLPASGQEQSSDSTGATSPDVPLACYNAHGDATYSGLPGAPKTIYFSGGVNCKTVYVSSVYGVASLYFEEFTNPGAFEARGTSCGYVPSCISSGSYFSVTQTAPLMFHRLDWRYTAVLNSGYQWAIDPSGHCDGAGTRTTHCIYQWDFSVPV